MTGAHTWALDRDLGQARLRKDPEGAIRIMAAILDYRATCPHVANPAKRKKGIRPPCYKCGQPMTITRKGQ
jgi:hypothetical protein